MLSYILSFVVSVMAGVAANGVSYLIKSCISKKTQQSNKSDTE